MKLLPVTQVLQSAKSYLIPSYKDFPNSSLHDLPLIIYRPFANIETTDGEGVKGIPPDEVEALLSKNGLTPAWRYGVSTPWFMSLIFITGVLNYRYPFNHYHSNTHEILVPYSGTAELAFGHHESPEVVKHNARPGDVYILPAGITHRSVRQSSDFQMVGSYPVGSHDWDNCKGGENDERKRDKLWESVKTRGERENRLSLDPVYGDIDGSPLKQLWR